MQIPPETEEWWKDVQAQWLTRLKPFSSRAAQHLFGPINRVPQSALDGARIFADREVGFRTLPKGGVVAEVGTQTGYFSEFILRNAQPIELHLFDLRFKKLAENRPAIMNHPKVTLHQGDSSKMLSELKDDFFDIIYIDADHALAGVERDVRVAVKKLKNDGYLVFNDYTLWSPLELTDYGVVVVVNRLLSSGSWRLIYFALQPLMYCDVALKRVK